VGTSGVSKLMKSLSKEGEVWWEFHEGRRLKDNGVEGA